MNLLITGAWQDALNQIESIKSMGHEVAFLQWEKDELPCAPEWVEGIIGNGIFLSHPIETFTNLHYIQLTSAGFDRVPMDYVQEHHIEIHNARGVYSIPMAEFAVGGVLELYKHFPEFHESQKQHIWNKIRNLQELNGKNVCILGCGSVGTECAKRFQAFGCHVIGVDIYTRDDPYYEAMLPLSKLDSILPMADILVMTVPLTDETRRLLNRERMCLLPEQAVIVNIARGGVMDYEAFDELKKSDRSDLRAVLDVFEEEPLSEESPLWEMDGVLVTPHNCFVGNGNLSRLSQVILSNVSKQ